MRLHVFAIFIVFLGAAGFRPTVAADVTEKIVPLGTVVAEVEKLRADGNTAIPPEMTDRLFVAFGQEADAEARMAAVPLLATLDPDRYLGIARKTLLDDATPDRLNDALWREVRKMLLAKREPNPKLKKFVEDLEKELPRHPGYRRETIKLINGMCFLISNHEKLCKMQSISDDDYAKFCKDSLMSEDDLAEKNFIEMNSLHRDDLEVSATFVSVTSIDQKHFDLMVKLLSHADPGVRMAAAQELKEHLGQDFGFNPVGSEDERAAAIEKWREYLATHDVRQEMKQ